MNTTKPDLPEQIALRRAADVIELFDDATMRADYMLDAGECAGIIRALADSPDYALSAIALASKEEVKVLRDVLESLYQMTSRYAISDSDYGIVCAAAAVLGPDSTAPATPTAPVLAAEAASVEQLAEVIYNSMTGSKAWPWQPGGNSHKQTEARIYADAVHAHVSALANSKTEAEFAPLFRFYRVQTVDDLLHAQEAHIAKLQAKLPELADLSTRPSRKG